MTYRDTKATSMWRKPRKKSSHTIKASQWHWEVTSGDLAKGDEDIEMSWECWIQISTWRNRLHFSEVPPSPPTNPSYKARQQKNKTTPNPTPKHQHEDEREFQPEASLGWREEAREDPVLPWCPGGWQPCNPHSRNLGFLECRWDSPGVLIWCPAWCGKRKINTPHTHGYHDSLGWAPAPSIFTWAQWLQLQITCQIELALLPVLWSR